MREMFSSRPTLSFQINLEFHFCRIVVMDSESENEQFYEASSELSPTPPATLSDNLEGSSRIDGVEPNDPLQVGADLANKAVGLFLDSDFEQIEKLLRNKRHSLLYASEGYAAIQYLRAMMTFTREAMAQAREAADSTISLTACYRKPRGVSALLSGSNSQATSRAGSPESDAASLKPKGKLQQHHHHHRWLKNRDSPLLSLRAKRGKRGATSDIKGGYASSPGSVVSMDSAVLEGEASSKKNFDPAMLDAKYGDLQDGGEGAESASIPSTTHLSTGGIESEEEDGPPTRQPQRSWASSITGMADSVIGMVRTGSQAVGLSKPEWQNLKAMTPTQRHAELVYAEAYLLRAILNIANGDGVMAVLVEGWHVRSAYATYRHCYAYIQNAYAEGSRVDDHFVSGTYLGIGIFNLILSMLPAKLLRFIELAGYSADRSLGLELLAIAAGWRTDPLTAELLETSKISKKKAIDVHTCGVGLRSEFCSLVLQVYHVFLCNDMFLGYPNLPLVDAVLKRSLALHPKGLLFMYFQGRLLMSRTQLKEAIGCFGNLIDHGKGAVKQMNLSNDKPAAAGGSLDNGTVKDSLVEDLKKMTIDEDTASSSSSSGGVAGVSVDKKQGESNTSEWRQLQYLGYWEKSLCLMSLGRWIEAAEGFNILRKENNWDKAVYTYTLACCLWERCLTIEDSDGEEYEQLKGFVKSLMGSLPSLKRKVAGKSIPIEKYVIRKASKFRKQNDYLLHPGLELLHAWNLYSKMPKTRLLDLQKEIEQKLHSLSQYTKDGHEVTGYRHRFFYDDFAFLLLTKGCILRELAYPSHSSSGQSPELEYSAVDTLLRLLRLTPLIERDHFLAVVGRFHLGHLYLATNKTPASKFAQAHWKCILGGKPLTSPPFTSVEEYLGHVKKTDGKIELEEAILQTSKHPSLSFYEGLSSADDAPLPVWNYTPPFWNNSKKYSLENMLEVRTFNSSNRFRECML